MMMTINNLKGNIKLMNGLTIFFFIFSFISAFGGIMIEFKLILGFFSKFWLRHVMVVFYCVYPAVIFAFYLSFKFKINNFKKSNKPNIPSDQVDLP